MSPNEHPPQTHQPDEGDNLSRTFRPEETGEHETPEGRGAGGEAGETAPDPNEAISITRRELQALFNSIDSLTGAINHDREERRGEREDWRRFQQSINDKIQAQGEQVKNLREQNEFLANRVAELEAQPTETLTPQASSDEQTTSAAPDLNVSESIQSSVEGKTETSEADRQEDKPTLEVQRIKTLEDKVAELAAQQEQTEQRHQEELAKRDEELAQTKAELEQTKLEMANVIALITDRRSGTDDNGKVRAGKWYLIKHPDGTYTYESIPIDPSSQSAAEQDAGEALNATQALDERQGDDNSKDTDDSEPENNDTTAEKLNQLIAIDTENILTANESLQQLDELKQKKEDNQDQLDLVEEANLSELQEKESQIQAGKQESVTRLEEVADKLSQGGEPASTSRANLIRDFLKTGENRNKPVNPSLDSIPARAEPTFKRAMRDTPLRVTTALSNTVSGYQRDFDYVWNDGERETSEEKNQRKEQYLESAKRELGEDASDKQLKKRAKQHEKSDDMKSGRTFSSRGNRLRKSVFSKLDRSDFASDEDYKDAQWRRVRVGAGAILAASTIALPFVLRGAPAIVASIDAAFDTSGGANNTPGDVNREVTSEESIDTSRYTVDTVDQNETGEFVNPGEYTAENIGDVDYTEYLSEDKISEAAMGARMSTDNIDESMSEMFNRAQNGPDHAAQMVIASLTESQLQEFGLDGLTPQQIEEQLHDNQLRADVLNRIEGLRSEDSITFEYVDNVSGSFYNWGAVPMDADGNRISFELAREQGIDDTELVQFQVSLHDATLLRVVDADGNTSYFNPECKNYLTEQPVEHVPIVNDVSYVPPVEPNHPKYRADDPPVIANPPETPKPSDGKEYGGGVPPAEGINPEDNTYNPDTDDTDHPDDAGNGTEGPSIDNGNIEQPSSESGIQDGGAQPNDSGNTTPVVEQGANGGGDVNRTDDNRAALEEQQRQQENQQNANDAARAVENDMSRDGAVDDAVRDAQNSDIDPVTGESRIDEERRQNGG